MDPSVLAIIQSGSLLLRHPVPTGVGRWHLAEPVPTNALILPTAQPQNQCRVEQIRSESQAPSKQTYGSCLPMGKLMKHQPRQGQNQEMCGTCPQMARLMKLQAMAKALTTSNIASIADS